MNEPDILLTKVVRPTLLTLDMYSHDAECLVLATAVIERQLLSGSNAPHKTGLYNISQSTHDDLWENFLEFRPEIVRKLCDIANQDLRKASLENKFGLLQSSDSYATAICRLMYHRVPKSIPVSSDKEAMALFWLKYFHSDKSAFANDLSMINDFKLIVATAEASRQP